MQNQIKREVGPRPWSWVQRLRFAKIIAMWMIWHNDQTSIRSLLCLASFGYAAGLWLPLHTFNRPPMAGMANAGPEWAWGLAFFAHGCGVIWRFASRRSVFWGFVVNGFGLTLWIVSTGLITQTIGEYSPNTAMELAAIFFAIIALIRTERTDEISSP